MTGEAHSEPRILATSGGRLEVLIRDARLIRDEPDQPHAPVLYFHGGHESAITAPASDLYVELGYCVVRVSRPGYGHTDVGPLPPAAFAPLIDEARAVLGIDSFTAVIGTSFGGPQAILRHLHAVITTGTGWDPSIATHGIGHRQADPNRRLTRQQPVKRAVGASPPRH
jgi:hypothetical protein